MDITSLTGITSDYIEKVAEQNRLVNTSDDSFQSVLDSAMNVLSETSDLQNDAEAAQIEFALGNADCGKESTYSTSVYNSGKG